MPPVLDQDERIGQGRGDTPSNRRAARSAVGCAAGRSSWWHSSCLSGALHALSARDQGSPSSREPRRCGTERGPGCRSRERWDAVGNVRYVPPVQPRFVGRAAELGRARRAASTRRSRPDRSRCSSRRTGDRQDPARGRGSAGSPGPAPCPRCGAPAPTRRARPAYWPWRQILRAWLALVGRRGPAADVAASSPGSRRSGVARLAPGGPAGPSSSGSRRFDAAARFFARAADGGRARARPRRRPVGRPGLDGAARPPRPGRCARAAAARRRLPAAELGEDAAGPLRWLISELPGSGTELRGLDEHAIAEALADRIGAPPAADVVAAVAAGIGRQPVLRR